VVAQASACELLPFALSLPPCHASCFFNLSAKFKTSQAEACATSPRIPPPPVEQASQVEEKSICAPSGVKTPEKNATVMSRLKAQPTNISTFSAGRDACATKSHPNGFPGSKERLKMISVVAW
jgi:hypothetical protein